jgi:hypothetical protein
MLAAFKSGKIAVPKNDADLSAFAHALHGLPNGFEKIDEVRPLILECLKRDKEEKHRTQIYRAGCRVDEIVHHQRKDAAISRWELHAQAGTPGSTIARGRQWLDDVVSGRVTTVAELCVREKCSVRQVNMTISLAFLAPNLVRAAVEGRLPRGVGIERLRDPPTEWRRQFEALGLNPE